MRELDYGEWSFMSTSTSLDQRLANGGRVNQLSVEKISSLSFRGRCASSSWARLCVQTSLTLPTIVVCQGFTNNGTLYFPSSQGFGI